MAVGWIRKRFPHINDRLLESIWEDLDNQSKTGGHPAAVTSPTPPSGEGSNPDLNQALPRKKLQSDPQNRPIIPMERTDSASQWGLI